MRTAVIKFVPRAREEAPARFKIRPWPLAIILSIWLWVGIWSVAKIIWAFI